MKLPLMKKNISFHHFLIIGLTVIFNACNAMPGFMKPAAISEASNTVPTVVITSTNTSSPTTQAVIPFTVTFSKSVTDFISSDLTVTNGTISSFAGTGASYTFNFTPTAGSAGTFTIDIEAGTAQDADLNNNTVATQYRKVFYKKTPTITGTTPTNSTTPILTVGNIIASLNANIYSNVTCTTLMGGPLASVGTTQTVTSSVITANTNYYSAVTDAQGTKSAW